MNSAAPNRTAKRKQEHMLQSGLSVVLRPQLYKTALDTPQIQQPERHNLDYKRKFSYTGV
jgi:hypothetical protein